MGKGSGTHDHEFKNSLAAALWSIAGCRRGSGWMGRRTRGGRGVDTRCHGSVRRVVGDRASSHQRHRLGSIGGPAAARCRVGSPGRRGLASLIDRLTGQYKKPALQLINVHEILERVYNLVVAETRGTIELIKDYDPSIPEITGDLSQLIQAVLNIVRNAMQALTESGAQEPKIIIRTRTINQVTIGPVMHKLVARIEIIDNGPGINPEIAETIFYPLISGRAEGTGLGLSLSQNILKNHNGLIECDSQKGKTIFTLSIPISDENPIHVEEEH